MINIPNIIATVQTIITIHTDDETVDVVTMSIDSTTNDLLNEQYSLYECTSSLLHHVKLPEKLIVLNLMYISTLLKSSR